IADALIVEGQARLAAPDAGRDYLRARPRLTSEPPAAPLEPLSARVTLAHTEETSALVASAALLEEPELRTWWPSPALARPFTAELAAARESPLLVSRTAQEDRVREVVRRAAHTLLPPATLARHLEGTAYVFAETERPGAARQALGVARALRARPQDAAD